MSVLPDARAQGEMDMVIIWGIIGLRTAGCKISACSVSAKEGCERLGAPGAGPVAHDRGEHSDDGPAR